MAVDFTKSAHTRTSEYLLAPKEIDVNPELNGRHDLPDIEWLVSDFVKRGQIQPVGIRNNGGRATLAFGHTRWRAGIEVIKRGLIPDFKLRCVYFKGNERDAFIANIAENRFRNPTSALDDAHNIRLLESWGKSMEEIAEIYRESPKWVKDRLKLIELAPEAQQAVKEGRLKPTAAVHIAKLSSEQQREAVKGDGKVKAPKATTNGHVRLPEFRSMLADFSIVNAETKQVVAFVRATLKYLDSELPEPDYRTMLKKLLGEK